MISSISLRIEALRRNNRFFGGDSRVAIQGGGLLEESLVGPFAFLGKGRKKLLCNSTLV